MIPLVKEMMMMRMTGGFCGLESTTLVRDFTVEFYLSIWYSVNKIQKIEKKMFLLFIFFSD